MKILIVDDLDALAFLIKEDLGEVHETTLAQNGVQALTMLQAETFDLVITDYLMPRMNGLELVNHGSWRCPTILWSSSPELINKRRVPPWVYLADKKDIGDVETLSVVAVDHFEDYRQ